MSQAPLLSIDSHEYKLFLFSLPPSHNSSAAACGQALHMQLPHKTNAGAFGCFPSLSLYLGLDLVGVKAVQAHASFCPDTAACEPV